MISKYVYLINFGIVVLQKNQIIEYIYDRLILIKFFRLKYFFTT